MLFNPETIVDRATFEKPQQYPMGVDSVLVNGPFVVTDGTHSNSRAGRILRRVSSGARVENPDPSRSLTPVLANGKYIWGDFFKAKDTQICWPHSGSIHFDNRTRSVIVVGTEMDP